MRGILQNRLTMIDLDYLIDSLEPSRRFPPISSRRFHAGGCDGNLKAIPKLVDGWIVEQSEEKCKPQKLQQIIEAEALS